LVLADLLSVDPEPGAVVGCPDVEKEAGVFFGLVSKVALIPDRPFVVEERLTLGVPVARNFQGRGFAEVVLGGEWIAGLGHAVEEPAIGLLLAMKAEEAGE